MTRERKQVSFRDLISVRDEERALDREYSQETLTQLLWAIYAGNRADAINHAENLTDILSNDGPMPPVLAAWIEFQNLAGIGRP